MYKKLLGVLFLLILTTSVFSACETTPDKIKRFNIEYTILNEKEANVSLTMVAEYNQEECIFNQIDQNTLKPGENYVTMNIECPVEFLDPVKTELGHFPDGLICTTTTIQDQNHIRMNFQGKISIPEQENKAKTIIFGGTDFTNNLPTDSSIKITIPPTIEFIDNYPKTGDKTTTIINWAPFPKQEIKLTFKVKETEKDKLDVSIIDQFSFIIIVIAVIVVIISLIVLFRKPKNIIIQKTENTPKENKRETAKALKEKIMNLEKMYLQGKIDETTYRRLIEQYNLQLNDLIIEIKKEEAKIAS